MVREERLELSRLAAPEPKSGVSTNSTTPADEKAGLSNRLGQRWWPGAESNCRHRDFQSLALPTELPGQKMGAF